MLSSAPTAGILHSCTTTQARSFHLHWYKHSLASLCAAVPVTTYCAHEHVQGMQFHEKQAILGSLWLFFIAVFRRFKDFPAFLSCCKVLWSWLVCDTTFIRRNCLLLHHCCHSGQRKMLPNSFCVPELQAVGQNVSKLSCFRATLHHLHCPARWQTWGTAACSNTMCGISDMTDPCFYFSFLDLRFRMSIACVIRADD